MKTGNMMVKHNVLSLHATERLQIKITNTALSKNAPVGVNVSSPMCKRKQESRHSQLPAITAGQRLPLNFNIIIGLMWLHTSTPVTEPPHTRMHAPTSTHPHAHTHPPPPYTHTPSKTQCYSVCVSCLWVCLFVCVCTVSVCCPKNATKAYPVWVEG